MELAVRLCVERGSDEQRAEAVKLLGELSRKDLSDAEEFALFEQFSEVITRASGNTVIMLARRGLKTQFLGRVHDREKILATEGGSRAVIVRDLARAFEERDGPGATEAAYRLGASMREGAERHLEARRSVQESTAEEAV